MTRSEVGVEARLGDIGSRGKNRRDGTDENGGERRGIASRVGVCKKRPTETFSLASREIFNFNQ